MPRLSVPVSGGGRRIARCGDVLLWSTRATSGRVLTTAVRLERVDPGDVWIAVNTAAGEMFKVIKPGDKRNRLVWDPAAARAHARALPVWGAVAHVQNPRGVGARRGTGATRGRRLPRARKKRARGRQRNPGVVHAATETRRQLTAPAWKRLLALERRVYAKSGPAGQRQDDRINRVWDLLGTASETLKRFESPGGGNKLDLKTARVAVRDAARLYARNNNPSSDAVRTFEKWHGFRPSAVKRVKGPPRVIPRELVELGEVPEVIYTSNKFTGRRETYGHKVGKPRPILATDKQGKHLYLVGGKIKVTERGLIG